MERLTKIDGCGQNDLIRCFGCGPEKAGENLENCGYCSEGWQRALNRLAAYEDTGLEPEDFKKAFNEDALLKMTAQYLGTTPDRLRQWAKADKEDRLVVLPCKEDDEVYVWLIGRVLPFEVTSVNLDGRGQPLFRAMHGLRLVYAFRTEDINKTVFLTREEAEAALAGERKDGDG